MTTRIIAGQFKRKIISVPVGTKTRPTLSRLRESLFGVFGKEIAGKCVCDLFAGSGSLGLEAMSRGAARAVFVEKDHRAVSCLNNNVTRLDLQKQVEIIRDDVFRFLKRCRFQKNKFDIMFADPDYQSGYAARVVNVLDSEPLLTTFLCVEHEGNEPPCSRLGFGVLVRTLSASDSGISVYHFGGMQ